MQQPELIELIATLQPQQTLVVQAEAGSGKTWAAMAAIAQLPDTAKVAVVAPTHIALRELRSKLWPSTICKVQFATTASFVGRYLEFDRGSGQLKSKLSHFSARTLDLVVIDEISAVPAIDMRRILSAKFAIAALGDREQLKAVLSKVHGLWSDEEQWQSLESGRSFTYVQLEGQHRNSGAILALSQKCRSQVAYPIISEAGLPVFYSQLEFEQDFVDAVQSAYANGGDLSQLCYLAYRNATVDRVASRLRTEVFGSDYPVIGEYVRSAGIGDFPVGDLLQIASVTPARVSHRGTAYSLCRVTFTDCEGEYLVNFDCAEYELSMATAKDDKDWDLYFELENLVEGSIGPANTMTVHKSQGRTIDFVWVDISDVGLRRQMLYVAYSRAKQRLCCNCRLEHHGDKGLPSKTELDAMRL